MDSKLQYDLVINALICPNCHMGTFYQHSEMVYRHEWNKCTGCGYMELKAITNDRVLDKLDPTHFNGSFKDPLTDEVRKKATRINIYGKNVK